MEPKVLSPWVVGKKEAPIYRRAGACLIGTGYINAMPPQRAQEKREATCRKIVTPTRHSRFVNEFAQSDNQFTQRNLFFSKISVFLGCPSTFQAVCQTVI
jgi:hypothetical protein